MALHTPYKTLWLEFETEEKALVAISLFRSENDSVRHQPDKGDSWMLARFNMIDDCGKDISIAFSSVIFAEVIGQARQIRWQAKIDEFVDNIRAEAKPKAGFGQHG